MSEIDDTALDWVARQSARDLDRRESAAFDAWYGADARHQGAYLRARALQHALDQLTVQDSQREAPLHRESANDAAPSRHRRAWLAGGALAAGMAALSVMSMRAQAPQRSIYTTAKGEFRKVPLADQSVLSINSASQVEVALSRSERRIFLTQGEAWFEVAKDKTKPFVVEAGDVRVRAVGTAFAVRRHEHGAGADVIVTEGVVDVWSDTGSAPTRQLGVGTHAVVAERASSIAVMRDPGAVERLLAWREGKLIFQHRTLADAVADFNRYNVRQLVIADPALRRKTLVGRYRIDQPEEFANDVRLLMNVPVAAGAGQIRIGATPARN